MLAALLYAPDLSFLDVMLAHRMHGVSFLHVSLRYPSRGHYYKSTTVTAPSPYLVVYADGLSAFKVVSNKLQTRPNRFAVLLHETPSVAERLGLPTFAGRVASPADIAAAVRKHPFTGLQEPSADPYEECLAPMKQESFVQKLYPAFYRITNKDARIAAQRTVYSYLAGNVARAPVIGINLIDSAIRGPVGQAIRAACILQRTIPQDQVLLKFPGVDDHTLNYVMAQVKKLTA